jgi:hypothetical protein
LSIEHVFVPLVLDFSEKSLFLSLFLLFSRDVTGMPKHVWLQAKPVAFESLALGILLDSLLHSGMTQSYLHLEDESRTSPPDSLEPTHTHILLFQVSYSIGMLHQKVEGRSSWSMLRQKRRKW